VRTDPLSLYPPEGAPLLAWCRSHGFDGAFVALHPFVALAGFDPRTSPYGTRVHDRSAIGDGPDAFARAMEEAAVDGEAERLLRDLLAREMKRSGRPVSWAEVGRAAGLPGLAACNRALLTTILALRREFADEDGAEALRLIADEGGLFLPTEGRFQPVMERNLAEMLRDSGVTRLMQWDDYGEEPSRIDAASLLADSPWFEIPEDIETYSCRLAAEDRTQLVAVHWDSFFTLICGTSARLRAARPEQRFEGFQVTEGWMHEWWREDPRLQPSIR
jgi:hypothetical protein